MNHDQVHDVQSNWSNWIPGQLQVIEKETGEDDDDHDQVHDVQIVWMPGQLHLIEKATGASYHMKWTAAISFFSFSTCSIVDQMRIENVCSLRLHWIVPRRWFVYSCIDLFPGVCRLSKEGQHVLSWTSEGVRRQTVKLWFLCLTNTQIWWHLDWYWKLMSIT